MAATKQKPAGRPPTVADNATLVIVSKSARTKLQAFSERRAIINDIIDNGGKIKMSALNESRGYDVRAAVLNLISTGWIQVVTK